MRDLNAIAGATFVTGLLNVHSLHRDKTLPNSWSYNIEDKTTEVAEHSQRIVELLGRIKKRKCLRTRKSALGLPYIAQNFGINIDTI